MFIKRYFLLIHHNAAYYAQGVVDGMANSLANVNIQYTYHVHEGTAGDIANGCYTTPTYHTHVTACKKTVSSTCGCTNGSTHTEYTSTGSYPCCTACHHYSHGGGNPCQFGTTSVTYICGYTANQFLGYTLGCGKTEDTIESAIIIY